MAGKEIGKATAIKSILSDLKKGIDKKSILSKISQKCPKDERTVRRWYSEAEKQYLEFKKKADPIIEAKEIEALGEKAKQGILSTLERQKILSEIASGQIPLQKPIVCNGEIQMIEVVPNWMDRKAAIAELNKMDGSYSPIKSEVTNIEKQLSPEERQKEIELLKKQLLDE